jgi:PKD repeat protein
MIKKYLSKVTIGALFLLGGFLICVNFSYAAVTDNVHGWAWSDNIGWISFNCYNDFDSDAIMGNTMTSECSGHNYGVHIATSTGVGIFSGHAWSDNIGWISFNVGDADCPDGINCSPEVVLSGANAGEVSGWAFVCHASDPSDPDVCNSATVGDDYGWISLRDLVNSYNETFINTTTGQFEDYAWGGGPIDEAVIGWVSFTGANYYVWTDSDIFNTPPYVTGLTVASSSVSSFCDGNASYLLRWTFRDDDTVPTPYESAYEIDITGMAVPYGLSGFSSTDYPDGASQEFSVPVRITEGLDDDPPVITYGTNYSWQVRVQDNMGVWSAWTPGPGFITPKDYPNCSFTMNPLKPKISEEVSFTDTSTLGIGSPSITDWSWNFGDGDTTTTQDPLHTYYEVEPIVVELTITDSDNRSCSTSTSFNVRPGKPEYIEVIPR